MPFQMNQNNCFAKGHIFSLQLLASLTQSAEHTYPVMSIWKTQEQKSQGTEIHFL